VTLPQLDCDVLRDVIVAEQCRAVIEIGLAYGSSALAIAEGLVTQRHAAVEHLIIDPYQDHFANAGWSAVRAAGLEGVCTLLAERSQLVLPRLVGDGVVVDAAFVDGSHQFHNVFVDLYYLWELVRPHGLVVLDDYQWPSVSTAVRYFERNAGWRDEPLPASTRLRAFRLPDQREERSFEEFQPFV